MFQRAVYLVVITLISAGSAHGAELVVMGTNTTAVPGAKVYTVGVQVSQADVAAAIAPLGNPGAVLGVQGVDFVGDVLNGASTNPSQLQAIQSG
jgi:hypothetical protein